MASDEPTSLRTDAVKVFEAADVDAAVREGWRGIHGLLQVARPEHLEFPPRPDHQRDPLAADDVDLPIRNHQVRAVEPLLGLKPLLVNLFAGLRLTAVKDSPLRM